MSDEFDAIYEQGVFRPLEPVSLPDKSLVHLQVRVESAASAAETSIDELARQQAAMRTLLDWVAKQPAVPPGDSVSAK
ncbi:MAG: antitoxin family protein [Pirellulales bacterium]|nr:antitoxin family protein [Pirellulales bacterium]